MTKFRIPVYWEMGDILEIEAESLEEAVKIAENMDDLPEGGEYIDCSFTVNEDIVREINEP